LAHTSFENPATQFQRASCSVTVPVAQSLALDGNAANARSVISPKEKREDDFWENATVHGCIIQALSITYIVSMQNVPKIREIASDTIGMLVSVVGLCSLVWVPLIILCQIFVLYGHAPWLTYPLVLVITALPSAVLGFAVKSFGDALFLRNGRYVVRSAIAFLMVLAILTAASMLQWKLWFNRPTVLLIRISLVLISVLIAAGLNLKWMAASRAEIGGKAIANDEA
jgi:hypothetical protein